MADQDKPSKIHLNLDKWEKEREKAELFSFVLRGKRWTMMSPEDIEWTAIIGAQKAFAEGDPRPILVFLLGDDQYTEFVNQKGVSLAMLSHLVTQATEHYGLTEPGEALASRP